LATDIKINTTDKYICSTINKELQGIHTGGSSSFKRIQWVRYLWPILRWS